MQDRCDYQRDQGKTETWRKTCVLMFIEISKSCITSYSCSTVRRSEDMVPEGMGIKKGVFALAGKRVHHAYDPGQDIWIVWCLCADWKGTRAEAPGRVATGQLHLINIINYWCSVFLSLERNVGHPPPTRLYRQSRISSQWRPETGVKGRPL